MSVSSVNKSGEMAAIKESALDIDLVRRKAKFYRLKLLGTRVAIVIGVLVLWHFVSGTLIDPFYISNPIAVFDRFYEWLITGQLVHHTWITVQETVLGFFLGAISGAVVGLILGRMKALADVCDPFIMAVYALPKIALAPLFILWLGIEIEMKIFMAAIVVFFLVFFNTFKGVRNVDQDLIDVIKLMGATEGQLLKKVIIPSALTWIFMGLKISVPYALIGAIVGEIIASNRGIGYLIQHSSGVFDTAGIFAALFVLMVFSTILNGLLDLVERKFMQWKDIEH